MIPVILSGGSGTRLWPMSRAQHPKQFCKLFTESLQVTTLKRVSVLGTPWIITSEKLRTFTEKSVAEAGIKGVKNFYEPFGRNTAPAVAWVCRQLEIEGRTEEVVGVFSADQLIQKNDAFLTAVKTASEKAALGSIVVLGIQPTYAATGYGYIQTNVTPLKFVEKPSQEMAEKYVQTGHYFWNAGIFIFKAQSMIELFKKHQPEMWAAFQKLKGDGSNLRDVYDQVKPISLDYAILEKLTGELACVTCDLGWSDVGSWDAVATINDARIENLVETNSKNNFVHPNKKKVYALIGVEDLIIVDTEDALLIAKKTQSEMVKAIVQELQTKNPKVLNEHVFEERPWGRFEILRDEPHFKSKIIEVAPGKQISYQSHDHREEHWVIIKGQGEIVLDETIVSVQPGSYVKVPTRARHRIRNTGRDNMEFIEVQLGTYFGEDDIVRYQDDYNRADN